MKKLARRWLPAVDDLNMCGFIGIVSEKKISVDALVTARDTMTHRGPDDSGLYVNTDGCIGLGFRRLSIIDLSPSGHQPMANENRTVWIVFNGEIYNFMELKKELEGLGHHFQSRSDSETILHGYEEWGTNILLHLRGMFAFAIWDENNDRIFLSTDMIGIKPLYYYYKNGLFAFASELKSLLKIPGLSKEVDVGAINQYFAFGYIPSEESIFRDIKKLTPGHYLVFSGDRIAKKKYYELPSSDLVCSRNEAELVEHLHGLINNSIKASLQSDVPVGVFLSGGIDSSLVATIAASYSSRPIQTFSIGFKETRYNELPFARKIATSISSDHHEFLVTIDSLDVLEKISFQYDEPFADSSAIPTYYVSNMAKKYVKVALSGDGGDELFGGYNWYMWVKNAQRLQNILGPFDKIASHISKILPDGTKGKKFLSTAGDDALNQFINRTFIFSKNEREKILSEELKKNIQISLPEEKIGRAFYLGCIGLIGRMQGVDLRYYLPYDGLVKVDRASMLSSVEVRPPYLDQRIIEFGLSLPEKFKVRGFEKKYLLKRLAKRVLPTDFPIERKQGFCLPLREWFCGNLSDILEDAISEKNTRIYLNSQFIKTEMSIHKQGKFDNSSKLWSILMFALWAKNYL